MRDPVLTELAAELPSLSEEELPRFEVRVRSRWRYVPFEPSADGVVAVHTLGLISFHPNGYRREEAVERLAMLEDGQALRYLILRMSDWVPQVRSRARRAVLSRIREDSAAALSRNFFLLTRAMRTDASLFQALVQLAAGGAHRVMLETAARRPGESARAIFRFLLDSVPEARQAAIAAGAISNDAVIRTWSTPLVDEMPLLVRLASDRVPAVRTRALTALAKSFPDEARPVLERAVLDRSTAVRDAARFLLGNRDYAAIYRDAIPAAARARDLAAALAGLAESGSAADAGIAAAFLGHPAPSVRRAAIRCAMRLDGNAHAERIVGMLSDPSSAASSAARDALRGHGDALHRNTLIDLYESAPTAHVRRNLVSLFAVLPKWQSIIALLYACLDDDEEIASHARRFVRDWNRNFNRRQTPPTRRELEQLTAVLASAAPSLDPQTAEALRFTLRSFPPAPAPPPGSRP